MGFVSLVGVVLIALGASVASADTATSNIHVTTTADAVQPACHSALSKDATATVSSTSSQWVLTITAKSPICEPVTAAIYAMPDNVFWPWPQQKVESTTFDVPAGTTVVTFTKTCGATQFDVVTGATPERIQPTTGPMHGPLLFTVNPWSATMNFGAPCGTTTTTPPTSVLGSTTIQSTTSTVPTSVEGTTTIPYTTTTPTSVLGETTIASTAPVKVEPATETRSPSQEGVGLAHTGFNGQALVVLGVTLVLVGVLARRVGTIRDNS
jgi:hypothetical protein